MRELIEAAYDNDISKEEQAYAYSWLTTWHKAERNLKYFTPHELMVFIIYEVNNKRRDYVVNRLLGRYSKAKRQLDWKKLKQMMEEKNARARNRAVSMSTRQGQRRTSDKTNLF